MTAGRFTTVMLLATVAGGGWLVGTGVRARSAIREVPVAPPGVAALAASTGVGLALSEPTLRGRASGGGGVRVEVPVVRIFGDYECSACRALHGEVGDSLLILADAGLIDLVYHHRPLSTHPRGVLAAEVAYCGAAAGRGFAVHDGLARDADGWSGAAEPLAAMVEAGARAGADRDSLMACVADGRMSNAVAADRRLADRLGVHAVPAVFMDEARLEFGSYAALLSHVGRKAQARRVAAAERQ